jgi:hypothetical protein
VPAGTSRATATSATLISSRWNNAIAARCSCGRARIAARIPFQIDSRDIGAGLLRLRRIGQQRLCNLPPPHRSTYIPGAAARHDPVSPGGKGPLVRQAVPDRGRSRPTHPEPLPALLRHCRAGARHGRSAFRSSASPAARTPPCRRPWLPPPDIRRICGFRIATLLHSPLVSGHRWPEFGNRFNRQLESRTRRDHSVGMVRFSFSRSRSGGAAARARCTGPRGGPCWWRTFTWKKRVGSLAWGRCFRPYDSIATLAELTRLRQETAAEEIWCLGDSFHDRHGCDRLPPKARELLTELTAATRWTWITGNHDPGFADHCGGQISEEAEVDGLILRHEADPIRPPSGAIRAFSSQAAHQPQRTPSLAPLLRSHRSQTHIAGLRGPDRGPGRPSSRDRPRRWGQSGGAGASGQPAAPLSDRRMTELLTA